MTAPARGEAPQCACAGGISACLGPRAGAESAAGGREGGTLVKGAAGC